MHARRLALNVPVAVLLTAALATAAAAASSAHASSSPRALPTWAHGSITGAGPHNGVRLDLVVWPKKQIRVDHKVHLQVVGTAKSTSTGSYAIHPTVTLPRGIHDLEVLAHSGVAVGAFSFARKITPGGAAEARHKMCAPVARNSRVSARDKNLRSASTSIPGPKHLDSSRSPGQRARQHLAGTTARLAGSRSRWPL